MNIQCHVWGLLQLNPLWSQMLGLCRQPNLPDSISEQQISENPAGLPLSLAHIQFAIMTKFLGGKSQGVPPLYKNPAAPL